MEMKESNFKKMKILDDSDIGEITFRQIVSIIFFLLLKLAYKNDTWVSPILKFVKSDDVCTM